MHPDATQAHSASLMLDGMDGVHEVNPAEPHLLFVRYDITIITLGLIEEVLVEFGYHLDNSLMHKLKRALYAYTEETQRANLGLEGENTADRKVFIQNYLRRRHGCRDERPEHWRGYL
ncbi:MAG: hypothetical protein ACNA75_07040 [Thiohalomonadaceae bacterium]